MTTQAERLVRIETLVEGIDARMEEDRAAQRRESEGLRSDIKALRKEFEADKAEMAAIKNRGIGLLIGVGAVSGTIGAALSRAWQGLFGG